MPDMADEISKRVSGNKGRVSYLTWGRHTATNEFTEVKYVILSGVLQYAAPHLEAIGRSAKALRKDEEFGDKEFSEIRLGEVAHHVLQAATRGAVRRSTPDGRCPPGCHLYVVCSTNKGFGIPQSLLAQVFPDAEIVAWKPITKLGNSKNRLIDGLVKAAQQSAYVGPGPLGRSLGLSTRTVTRLLGDEAVVAAVRSHGYEYRKGWGRIYFSKVTSAPQDRYDGGLGIKGMPV